MLEPPGSVADVLQETRGRGELLVPPALQQIGLGIAKLKTRRRSGEERNGQGCITGIRQTSGHAAHPVIDAEDFRQQEHASLGVGWLRQPATQGRLHRTRPVPRTPWGDQRPTSALG